MNAVPMHIRRTRYPAARRVMKDAAADLDDSAVADYLESVFPDASAQEIESFMRSLQSFGRSIAPVVKQAVPIIQRAAPGAIQGALQGGMVAGPWGALAGAGIGAAGSLLSQPPSAAPQQQTAPASPAQRQVAVQQPAPSRAGPAPRRSSPTRMQTSPVPQATTQAGVNPAVTQLLALLSRPETMQALMSLAMAGRGRAAIPVGQRQVPPAAFANAIAEYASAATHCACGDPTNEHNDWSVHSTDTSEDWFDPTVRAEQLAALVVESTHQGYAGGAVVHRRR